MKKLMNKSFWIILSISLITLIGLTVGVILLTKESQNEFYSAGYIINTTASKSNKYYFEDKTTYKENIFDEYVFKNKENKEVSSPKNNFIHYSDGSLSFMQKGVILDLDKFNKNMAPYYNITDKSIIKYNNGNYYIETSDKTLTFGNFLGKITDDKYIIVGNDINIKLAGSEETVKGKYFEFMFVEDGIVKIVNEKSSYQTITEGTVIYVGDNIEINLGDKSIISGNELKISLDEMTINGDENIDIKPTDGKVDKGKENNGKEGSGEGQNGTGTDITETNNNDGGINGEGTVKTVLKKEVTVDLINAKVDANNIYTEFQVIDTGNYIKGNLILTLQNITKEEENISKEIVVNAGETQKANFSDLTPNCNYLMTITEKNDVSETQYFRRVFKTQSINDTNVKLEMADTNSLEYIVEFNNEKIKSGVVTLTLDGKSIDKTVVNQGVYSNVVFDGLKSNKKYDVSLSNIIYSNSGTADIVDTSSVYIGSNMTLKKTPKLGKVSYIVDEEKKLAKLVVEAPDDNDGSITKYTYKIYKKVTLELEDGEEQINYEPAYEFEKMRNQLETKTIKENDVEYKVIATNEEKISVDNKKIFSDTEYVYKVVAEYYDNYKYGEIETNLTNPFIIPKDDATKVTFVPDDKGISFNQIKGTIKITDNECTIPNINRDCNDSENKFIIKYTSNKNNDATFIENAKFEEKQSGSNVLEYHMNLTGLSQNTTYSFEVYANAYSYDEMVTGKYIGSFIVTTEGIDNLKMQNWNQNNYSYDVPISVSAEITSTVADSDLINKLSTITYKLYRGKKTEGEPIGSYTVTGSDIIKNQTFNITSKGFGIENLDELRELSGGKLNDYYTIEVTDAYDEGQVNRIKIENNTFVYSTPPLLILEDEVSDIKIIVDEITNEQTESGNYEVSYNSELNDDIVVGYKVTASIIDMQEITRRYDPKKINFYAYNHKNKLIERKTMDIEYDKSGHEINSYVTYFFLKNGTDYNIEDKDLRRGNGYIFAFDISIDTDNDAEEDTTFPSGKVKDTKKIALKQNPAFKMYIDSSTENSITYKYSIDDIDNTFYIDPDDGKKYLYYTVNDSEEEYKSELETDSFTINNLANEAIYNINYYRANDKTRDPSKVKYNSYYFDGYYNIENFDYNLQYNDDNQLKIVLDNNDLMSRVSEYLVTLSTNDNKYQKLFTQKQLSNCEENKCIIIDYAEIKEFKNKNITISVDAFYDTGYTGISMKGKLGNYFANLGFVEENKKSTVGYVYQDNGSSKPGNYYHTESNILVKSSDPMPIGIHIAEFSKNDTENEFTLKTINLVDNKQKFISNEGISLKEFTLENKDYPDGLSVSKQSYALNPKVLDKVSLNTIDNSFKFTSIIPKISTEAIPTINGAKLNVNLSIDSENDFVKTNNEKYKFYVDIYIKETEDKDKCIGEFVKTVDVETEIENNKFSTEFDELTPDTKYCYIISADMNKNGEAVKTPLFNSNEKNKYIEYNKDFSTLDADKIMKKVTYNYESTSEIEKEKYTVRKMTTDATLKTNINFTVRFEIRDPDGNLEYCSGSDSFAPNEEDCKGIVPSEENLAKYIQDISSDQFVFGPGYHTLTLTAITTDNKKNELVLYNEKIINNDQSNLKFPELASPVVSIEPTAITTEKNGEYNYSINAKIIVDDSDRVIKNSGEFTVELQEAIVAEDGNEGYKNACSKEEDCRFTFKYFENGEQVKNGNKAIAITAVDGKKSVEVTFNNLSSDKSLSPNKSYYIHVYGKTYRNNYHKGALYTEEEKNGSFSIRKNQYTNSELGFSLGLVTPTATADDKLIISFTGSSNIPEKIVGISYSVDTNGGINITSDTIGKTPKVDKGNIEFIIDNETKVPTIEISVDVKKLDKKNKINLTYYYKDNNGDIKALNLNGETVHSLGIDL